MSVNNDSGLERRTQTIKVILAESGIDEAMIERLVRQPYERVRADAIIGQIFAARIADWEAHLKRMCAFWSSVALMSGRYHGQPMHAHLPLPVDGSHFDRWLELFEATTHEGCPPRAAHHFIERARIIARCLELGVAAARGVMPGKGDRLRSRRADRSMDRECSIPLTLRAL
jgi:hemoglobin